MPRLFDQYRRWRRVAVADVVAAFNRLTSFGYTTWEWPKHKGIPIETWIDHGDGRLEARLKDGDAFEIIIRKLEIA